MEGGEETADTKSNRVTQTQLSKFQELQRRRLQLISKPKNKKFKAKGPKTILQYDELHTQGYLDDKLDQNLKDPSIGSGGSQRNESSEMLSSSPEVDVHPAFRKKKLHWGLDSKERWERKANM